MAKQIINGDKVRVECMSVAGGDLKSLPKGHKYYINLILDYEGVELSDAIQLASEGSSMRVKAQAKLREMEAFLKEHGVVAESAKDVKALDLGTAQFSVANDFESEGRTQNPEKRAASAFSKLGTNQKVKFVMDALGVDEPTARKHMGLDS